MSMIQPPARPRRAEHGQTLVIFAVFLVVLLASAALAIDYGSLLKVRRDYQNVADAAVLAGSVFLTRPVTPAKAADAREAAWKSIEDQLGVALDETGLGATDAPSGGVTVGPFKIWVSTPPGGATPGAYTGAYAGSNRVLFAHIERPNPAFLSRLLGFNEQVVSAWATAGTFPNRFAIITLRKNGDPTSGNPTNIDVNGGTHLNVHDGDVGGNWGMAINGVNSAIIMHSASGDTYGVFMPENVPSGGNGWTANQVRDSGGTPLPVQFHAEVADPMYPAPCLTTVCLEDRTPVWGSSYTATTDRPSGGDSCPATGLDVLAPGIYNDIRVPNGKCLVLDPTKSPVAGKQNGVYYITGDLDLNNDALLLGDGVTLVFARNADMDMNAGASISLNSGNATNNPLAAACNPNCKFAGWAAKGGGGGTWTWSTGLTPTYTAPADPFVRGIASYVCRSVADCGSGGGPSTNILQMNAGAGIDYKGLIYAPFDNVKLAGQPTHDDIGQLVAWTVMFTGGSDISQTFDGPDSGTPVLLEPRLGQ
jgi:hypothetical protein